MNMTRIEYSENLYNALPLSLNLSQRGINNVFCDSCGPKLGNRKEEGPVCPANSLLYFTVPDNSGRVYGVTTLAGSFLDSGAWPLTEQSEALSAIIDFNKANVLSLEKA